jgi:uncharacterized protein YgiM (DUF1202 family)
MFCALILKLGKHKGVPMNLLKIVLLILLSLACSLTSPIPPQEQPIPVIPSSETLLFVVAEATASPDPKTCVVTAATLHLRECAGLHCTVTDWLPSGEVLMVLDTDQDWFNVTTPAGKSGWVHSNYCGGSQ